jgi:multidrug efflux pump subunit AcrB
VQSQNIQAALGRVGAAPTTNEQQVQLTIKTKGRLTRPQEFANIVLRTNPDGSGLNDRDTPIARHGNPGQAYCSNLALAEWLCRTADWIDTP